MSTLKVLLVDDEEELVFTLAERLGLRGLEADAVTDGSQALDMVGKKRYDVIVIDLKMPGLSGLAVMKTIKRDYPNIGLIMLTGHGSTEESAEGLKAGAFDYLIKPVKIDELIAKIKSAASQRGADEREQ